MDFKGIKWVGNLYQKFEAMCLEVEEIIVQDTAKYIENQVQTVGAGVQKFYSDVVHDLLPESSLNSVKPPPASMLNECASIFSFEKSKGTTNDKISKEDFQVILDMEKTDGGEAKFHGLHMGDYSFQSRKYDECGAYRKTKLGARKISRKENLSQLTRNRVGNHVKEISGRGSTVHIPSDKGYESLCDSEAISSNESLAEVTRFNSAEENCQENGNAAVDVLSDMSINPNVPGVLSDTLITSAASAVEFDENKETEIGESCSGNLLAESHTADESMDDGMASHKVSSMKVAG